MPATSPIQIATIALSLLSICIAAIALYNSHYRRKVEVVIKLVRAWAKNSGASLMAESRERDEVGISICVTNCGNTPIVLFRLYAFSGDITQPSQWLYEDDDFVPVGVRSGDSAIITFNLRTLSNYKLPTDRLNDGAIHFSFEAELHDYRGYEAHVNVGNMSVKSICTDGFYTGGSVNSDKWKFKKKLFRKPKFILLNGSFNK